MNYPKNCSYRTMTKAHALAMETFGDYSTPLGNIDENSPEGAAVTKYAEIIEKHETRRSYASRIGFAGLALGIGLGLGSCANLFSAERKYDSSPTIERLRDLYEKQGAVSNMVRAREDFRDFMTGSGLTLCEFSDPVSDELNALRDSLKAEKDSILSSPEYKALVREERRKTTTTFSIFAVGALMAIGSSNISRKAKRRESYKEDCELMAEQDAIRKKLP